MASPSCSSAPGGFKYDVFLSYRGDDTLKTFTSHLRAALDRKKINTFRDDQLERGEEMKPAFLKVIEGSKLSVVILSQNYASSTWCLEELDQILDCKERYQQLVIPILYEVDPSHVRYQRESFEAAFVQHEQHFKDTPDKVLKWRDALTKVSNLAGFDSRNIGTDSELVEKVVKDIAMKLNRECSSDSEGLVGIEFQLCIALDDQFSNGKKLDRSVAEDKCFKCGGRGHWARVCPSPGDQERHGLSQAGGEDSNNDYTGYSYGGWRSTYWEGDKCFNCGGRGHWQHECPSE